MAIRVKLCEDIAIVTEVAFSHETNIDVKLKLAAVGRMSHTYTPYIAKNLHAALKLYARFSELSAQNFI